MLGVRGLAGRCRIAGTPQVRPCRLGRRIHAADTPQSDTAPPWTASCELLEPAADGGCRPLVGTSVRYRMNHPRMAWLYWHLRLLVGVDLGRHEFSVRYRNSSGVRARCAATGSDPVPTNGRHPPEQNAVPTDRGELSKAGWVRLRGREPHGCGDRAYRDVLAASPSTGPTPPTLRKPAFDVDVEVASAGAGCKPCIQHTHAPCATLSIRVFEWRWQGCIGSTCRPMHGRWGWRW